MERAAVTRRVARRGERDLGITLVEIVIAVVLSGIVSAVLVATLATSLNVVDSTTQIVHSSTDEALLSTYLARDAQAAAGTDPSTASAALNVGVSVPAGGGGWGTCAQTGTLVARFAWVDRSGSGARSVETTWALRSDGQLVRRTCDSNGTVDLVLGREIASAVAACAPVRSCTGNATRITLSVTGLPPKSSTYTLDASLRGEVQVTPDTTAAAVVPFVVLGEQSRTGACPVLQLSGTGGVNVRGGAIVSSSCGAAPVSGDQTQLRPTGRFDLYSGVPDPYADLAAPTSSCATGSGLAPGASTGANTVTVHTTAVTLSGSVVFQPGRHVFCQGVTVAAGATITGTGVLWYVPNGGVRVDATSTIDLTAATTGPYTNLLIWSVGSSAVDLLGGSSIDNYRGVVYAPQARVTVDGTTASHLGGLVSAQSTLSGSAPIRIGLPIPVFTSTPSTLPTGQSGVAYPLTTVVVSGGTAPMQFGATGLPAGLVMSAGGGISGTPTVSGSFTVVVTATDATGAVFQRSFPLTVRVPLAVASPSTLTNAQVGASYAAVTYTASGGLSPYSWSATGLPTGMTFSSAGVLSGTPTSTGDYAIVATVSDSGGGTATRTIVLTVAPSAAASNPFAAAQRFQILTSGDATLAQFGIEGAAAIGGNLVFRNYQSLATVETSTFVPNAKGLGVGLVVGGRVDLATSGPNNQLTVANGFFHAGSLTGGTVTVWGTNVHLATTGVNDNWSTPRVIVTANQSDQTTFPVLAPGMFDTTSVFNDLRRSSESLGALDPRTCAAIVNPVVTSAYGNYTLTLTSGKVNVWNLTVAQITSMVNVSGPVNPSASTPLVINVTDAGAVVLPTRYWSPLQNGTKSAIMWNFPNATSVTASGAFYGSLFAPNAAVSVDNVTFEGDLVARTANLTQGTYKLAHWTTAVPCTLGALSVQGPAGIADGQVGVAMSATMDASGGTGIYSWSATGLPPGVTLSSAGALSGTPTSSGTYSIVASVTDSSGATARRTYTVNVRAALAVATPSSLAAGQVGTAYTSVTFTASGGLAPYTWSASNLHTGLSLSSAGVLSGTPTSNGTRTVTVTVTDAGGVSSSRTYGLTVNGAVCPTITGWKAEFWNNTALTGPTVLCRDDSTVNFDWSTGAPDPAVNADQFSVRWTRTQSFAAGTYRFTIGGDDGLRLYVDGTRVVDAWYDQSYATYTTYVDLTAGNHTIVMEMYENGGYASATLTWTTSIPASCPTPDSTKWTMEIYDGIALANPLVDCKSVSNLDTDWGSGTPDSRVGNDQFSIRWTRTSSYVGGTYQFVAGSDDGVRVYLDGTRIIDAWGDRSYGTSTATVAVGAGNHTIVMEFYENGGAARASLAITKL
ncbi:MAG: collagen-binding domain-containing protein [Acidimicrobiales bacterium]